jgi:hypothetical protein
MAWNPTGPAWQYELLDRLPPGVDTTQLDWALGLTPTERLEELERLMRLAEEVSRAGGHRPSQAD